MKQSNRLQSGQISKTFLVIITFVITAFVAAMIYILNLQTPREKFDAERAQQSKVAMALEAQEYGMSLAEFEKIKEERTRQQKHIYKILGAITQKDDAKLAALFKEIPDYDFAKYKPDIYKHIAIQKNEKAFRYFLEQGVPCDYKSPVGQNALTSLLQKEYEKYFNILIEHGCDIGVEQSPAKIQAAFANSYSPERVLLFPLSDANKAQYENAFVNVITSKNTKAAYEFIERGVNINTLKLTRNGEISALGLSIDNDLPELAVSLLEKGADLVYKKDRTQARRILLLTVLQKKQIPVFKAILKRDPQIITREKLANEVLSYALQMHDADRDFSVISLAFENGVTLSDLTDEGTEIIFSAVRMKNYRLVEKLLALGIDPNRPERMITLLSLAKQNKRPEGQDIVDLLIRKGAVDDYLSLVRKERGIKDISNCSIGENIELVDVKSQMLSAPKRKTDRMLRQKSGVCLTAIALCVNEGNGADDCVKSQNTCKTLLGSKALGNSVSDIEVCCSTEFKQNYAKARCSGLNVMESYKWLDTQ